MFYFIKIVLLRIQRHWLNLKLQRVWESSIQIASWGPKIAQRYIISHHRNQVPPERTGIADELSPVITLTRPYRISTHHSHTCYPDDTLYDHSPYIISRWLYPTVTWMYIILHAAEYHPRPTYVYSGFTSNYISKDLGKTQYSRENISRRDMLLFHYFQVILDWISP